MGQGVQMRVVAGFIYSFVMTVCTLMLIHICIGSSAVCMTLRHGSSGSAVQRTKLLGHHFLKHFPHVFLAASQPLWHACVAIVAT